MRRYVLSEDTIIEESQRVTTIHPLFDAVEKYKYILIDHTALTKMDITNETVEFIAGLCAGTSKVNPDSIVAMVTDVTIGANIDLINRISRMYELFIHRSCWETMVFRTKSEAVRWIREKVRDKFGIDDLIFG